MANFLKKSKKIGNKSQKFSYDQRMTDKNGLFMLINHFVITNFVLFLYFVYFFYFIHFLYR